MADENQAPPAGVTEQQPPAGEAPNLLDKFMESDEPISPETLKKIRGEVKGLRDRTKDAEGKVSQYETEKLSDSEKLNKKLTDALKEKESAAKDTETANGRTKRLLLERALDEIGKPLGMRSAKTTAKFVEPSGLEFDLDKLTVNGLADELKRIKAENPDQFIDGASNDGGKGNDSRAGKSQNMNDLIHAALGRK